MSTFHPHRALSLGIISNINLQASCRLQSKGDNLRRENFIYTLTNSLNPINRMAQPAHFYCSKRQLTVEWIVMFREKKPAVATIIIIIYLN